MHATEALLSRALNYHLFGLAHHVQRLVHLYLLVSAFIYFSIVKKKQHRRSGGELH